MAALRQTKHILVLCDQEHSHREVPGSDCYRLSYCAAGSHDMDEISVPEQGYDWLLVDGSLMGGDGKEFIRTLRAIDTFCAQGKRRCRSSCRVEWAANGVLQLHCCMQEQASISSRKRGPSSLPADVEGFVFEYHAPMKNTG